jgi:hypothetical protein
VAEVQAGWLGIRGEPEEAILCFEQTPGFVLTFLVCWDPGSVAVEREGGAGEWALRNWESSDSSDSSMYRVTGEVGGREG